MSDHHHHKETFVTKYIFSQDHKMIAKQYLITGMFMGVIGVFMSMLFRLQLAYPDQSFTIIEAFLGKWGEGGQMTPDMYSHHYNDSMPPNRRRRIILSSAKV